MKSHSAPPSGDTQISEHDRLRLLREHDPLRVWRSLADQRTCLSCGEIFTGRSIKITRLGSQFQFACPALSCSGSLADFAVGGNPFADESVWADWCKTLDQV